MKHMATLNLFVDPDGLLYVTVADADIREVIYQAEQLGIEAVLVPHDKVIALVRRAENMQQDPAP